MNFPAATSLLAKGVAAPGFVGEANKHKTKTRKTKKGMKKQKQVGWTGRG
jgi:hypothetical protein